MKIQTKFLGIRLPIKTKRLLAARARKARVSVSAYTRCLIEAALIEPAPVESVIDPRQQELFDTDEYQAAIRQFLTDAAAAALAEQETV